LGERTFDLRKEDDFGAVGDRQVRACGRCVGLIGLSAQSVSLDSPAAQIDEHSHGGQSGLDGSACTFIGRARQKLSQVISLNAPKEQLSVSRNSELRRFSCEVQRDRAVSHLRRAECIIPAQIGAGHPRGEKSAGAAYAGMTKEQPANEAGLSNFISVHWRRT
jgi:hypothetical protein